jgi:hypothetical protein
VRTAGFLHIKQILSSSTSKNNLNHWLDFQSCSTIPLLMRFKLLLKHLRRSQFCKPKFAAACRHSQLDARAAQDELGFDACGQ